MGTTNIFHQISRLSEKGVQVLLYLIPSHIGILSCKKVDQVAKLALSHEHPYYRVPLSLKQMKKCVISCLQDCEGPPKIIGHQKNKKINMAPFCIMSKLQGLLLWTTPI